MKFTFSHSLPKDKDATLVTLSADKESVVVEQNGKKIIKIGIGERNEMTRRKLFLLARQVIALAKANRAKKS